MGGAAGRRLGRSDLKSEHVAGERRVHYHPKLDMETVGMESRGESKHDLGGMTNMTNST